MSTEGAASGVQAAVDMLVPGHGTGGRASTWQSGRYLGPLQEAAPRKPGVCPGTYNAARL